MYESIYKKYELENEVSLDMSYFGIQTLPPYLPHELVKLCGAKFAAIIRNQQGWLQEWVLAVEANKIKQDFQDLIFCLTKLKNFFKMSLINMTTRQHFTKAGILYMLILSNWKTSVVE